MSATTTETIELAPPSTAAVAPPKPIPGEDETFLRAEPSSGPGQPALRKDITAIIFASITGVTGISSLLSGLVTVVLPIMARDLALSDSVLLWYSSSCNTEQKILS